VLAAIDLTFTEEARSRITAFLGSITEYSPTLTLMKGTTNDDSTQRWTYGAYGPENIKTVEALLLERGKPLLYSVDGMVAAIPQFEFVHELEGKTMGLGVRGLVVLEREHDV
jgi:hypothetical protein